MKTFGKVCTKCNCNSRFVVIFIIICPRLVLFNYPNSILKYDRKTLLAKIKIGKYK